MLKQNLLIGENMKNQENTTVQNDAAEATTEVAAKSEKKIGGKLNLIPNEVVGYRIHPDQYNWTVVIVKRHGKDSKHAGQEYESPLAYCKNVESATSWIVNHVAAMEGKKLQEEKFDSTGVAASMEALMEGFKKAEAAALWTVNDLEARLKEAGYDFKDMRKNQLGDKAEEAAEEEVEKEA